MPPTLSRSQTSGSIRKSSRIADAALSRQRIKDASDFLDGVIGLHKQALAESANKTVISNKKDDAVEPLNNPNFIRTPFTIIGPDTNRPGTFTFRVTNFLDILNWEGKSEGAPYPEILSPPPSTLGIRKPFDDFNDVLKKDQAIKGEAVTLVRDTAEICKLGRSRDLNVERHRQQKRQLQKDYQHMCFYCGRKIKTKDPDVENPVLVNSQCDHIFPIASALICLKRDANLIYNFQSVHRECNAHASAMKIDRIWDTVGTPEFTTLTKNDWCVFVKDGQPAITKDNTQEWCRGYLALLLRQLTLVSAAEQQYRKLIFEKVIRSYQTYKDEVRLLMEDNVAQGVQYLTALSASTVPGPSTSAQLFGVQTEGALKVRLISIVKLNGDKKKYEAVFIDKGTQKTQKFGASGMSDYTIHKDINRRNRYIARHLKDLDTNDPTRAGYLSMFILWNKPSLDASIDDYRRRLTIYNETGRFPIDIEGYPTPISSFGVPPNVKDKTLYQKIKEQIQSGIKGRKWGAYDSGRLVRMYKQKGGTYTGNKQNTPLGRWYDEKWVNACKWPQNVPCGRKDMNNKMAYCRPSIRVTKDTPTTVKELTQAQIDKRCKIKQSNPLIRITPKS